MVDLFFCSLFINHVGVKHLPHSLSGKIQDIIRLCFTMIYRQRDLIQLSSTRLNQGEAFGYKTLGFSPNISPKCFAPTGGEFDREILSLPNNNNYVGVKHLRQGWCGETQYFIRKCFTLADKLRHSLWGKIPDFIRLCFTLVHQQWELITLSLTDKQGEAFGYKTLGFSNNISPKCFAPTGEEFDVDI